MSKIMVDLLASISLAELGSRGVVLEGKRLSVTTIKGETLEGTCGQIHGSWCLMSMNNGVREPIVAENVRLTRVDFLGTARLKRRRNGH